MCSKSCRLSVPTPRKELHPPRWQIEHGCGGLDWCAASICCTQRQPRSMRTRIHGCCRTSMHGWPMPFKNTAVISMTTKEPMTCRPTSNSTHQPDPQPTERGGGQLLLGTWQAVYLWEHRGAAHTRTIACHLFGAPANVSAAGNSPERSTTSSHAEPPQWRTHQPSHSGTT